MNVELTRCLEELAECLNYMYGSVCYVGIDIDPELKYPKGAARVTFTTTQAYIAAISGRFVHVNHAESQKRVSLRQGIVNKCFRLKSNLM